MIISLPVSGMRAGQCLTGRTWLVWLLYFISPSFAGGFKLPPPRLPSTLQVSPLGADILETLEKILSWVKLSCLEEF